MALAGREGKVHRSVKESTLRSIFTPSREANNDVKGSMKKTCVCLSVHTLHNYILFHINFSLLATWLQTSGGDFSFVVGSKNADLYFRQKGKISHDCWRGYEVLEMMTCFIPHLFICLSLWDYGAYLSQAPGCGFIIFFLLCVYLSALTRLVCLEPSANINLFILNLPYVDIRQEDIFPIHHRTSRIRPGASQPPAHPV